MDSHYEFDDDPLINMKKYKIQNVRNEEDWDKADNTLTNIKHILYNFPQDDKSI